MKLRIAFSDGSVRERQIGNLSLAGSSPAVPDILRVVELETGEDIGYFLQGLSHSVTLTLVP